MEKQRQFELLSDSLLTIAFSVLFILIGNTLLYGFIGVSYVANSMAALGGCAALFLLSFVFHFEAEERETDGR